MGKVYDGIMGLIVGDALGVPVEFKQRDSFVVTGMVGYGTYNQKPGTWSDDSSMTLATLDSLVRNKGKIVLEDIMQNFYKWLFHCKFTPYGDVFDVGGTTRRAINLYARGYDLDACGCDGEMDNGNGSLMRILPLAFVPHTANDIHAVSALTHKHSVSKFGCELYLAIAENLIKGMRKQVAVDVAVAGIGGLLTKYERFADHIERLNRNDIRSSGYVVDTLEAAVWCFLNTDSYKDCVLLAVNLGSDTDTVAAVAGGLAGIYYGCSSEKGIPDEWIAQIPRLDWIKGLCENLES